MNPAIIRSLLPVGVLTAAVWVRMRERKILRTGVTLESAQLEAARLAGVLRPERVRLLCVQEIEVFDHPLLMPLRVAVPKVFAQTAGLTLRYGILIRADYWGNHRLVVHELVHTGQYERLGGIVPFLRLYLQECVSPGYPLGPLEQEAIQVARRICSLE